MLLSHIFLLSPPTPIRRSNKLLVNGAPQLDPNDPPHYRMDNPSTLILCSKRYSSISARSTFVIIAHHILHTFLNILAQLVLFATTLRWHKHLTKVFSDFYSLPICVPQVRAFFQTVLRVQARQTTDCFHLFSLNRRPG